jgi:hypothetical protein
VASDFDTTDLLIVSPCVVAELDYLVATRHRGDAEPAVLEELSGGAWELTDFGTQDLPQARSIIAAWRSSCKGCRSLPGPGRAIGPRRLHSAAARAGNP